MASANEPITIKETFTLSSVGINPTPSTNFTMESGNYLCVREEPPQNSVEIIDMSMPAHPLRRSMRAHSGIMNPISPIVALKAVPGTTQNHIQMFNIEMNAELKSYQMPEWVVFWKWFTPKLLAMATKTSVYHWSIEGDSEPVKMFDRTDNIPDNRFVDYKCDPSEKWLLLIGLAPGSPERPRLNRGNVQLYSVDQQRCQALEATEASFASFKVGGILPPSLLLCLATKSYNAGQVSSKLHISELGARPGESSYSERESNFVYPPGHEDDVPVGMEISQKYGLIYVVTMCGLLFVCDLESSTILYRNRIITYPIVMSCEAASVGGVYVVSRRGDVLLATVNESMILPYISGELNNLGIAVNLAKRGNIPGAENLFVQRFQELFAQAKYKEAAIIAADSPQDILRTPDTLAKFKDVRAQAGQTAPVLLYFSALLRKGKLNAFESLELFRIISDPKWLYILEKWLAEDKVECTEELGDVAKWIKISRWKFTSKQEQLRKWLQHILNEKSEKILIYSNQVGYAPDYLFLLETILQSDPQEAVNFALMMAKMDGGCPVDYNTITDVFIQKNLIREATTFLLDVLKPNLPEHAHLQTKVLEINLIAFPDVADAILAGGMFSHYDQPRIAQLCEEAGLNARS